ERHAALGTQIVVKGADVVGKGSVVAGAIGRHEEAPYSARGGLSLLSAAPLSVLCPFYAAAPLPRRAGINDTIAVQDPSPGRPEGTCHGQLPRTPDVLLGPGGCVRRGRLLVPQPRLGTRAPRCRRRDHRRTAARSR